MEWEVLDFANADAVISECRSAVSALEKLDKQAAQQGPQVAGSAAGRKLKEAIATLVAAIERRVDVIQRFYNDNDLNPKASQFEMCRLMLKRALMQHTINESGGVLGAEGAVTPVPSIGALGESGRSASNAQVGHANSNSNNNATANTNNSSNTAKLSAQSSFAFGAQSTTTSFANGSFGRGGGSGVGPSPHTNASSGRGASSSGETPDLHFTAPRTVTLKVILTREEYEEVLRRRASNNVYNSMA